MSENSVDCRGCGFVFADIPPVSIPLHLTDAARGYRHVLRAASAADLMFRTSETTWSALEYSCHVRDVLLNLRERVVLALVENDPVFAPLHREERVRLARYNAESAQDVGAEVSVAARLLGWLWDGLDGDQLTRRGVYAGTDVDVVWIGRQALHEARHHLDDIRRGLRQTR